MKKNVTYIRNKKGSMLMLTLIVFMVILILGMTMITSMLYSQGENNMQINKQKAYYAAQSAADAVKYYFLNPNSPDIKPYDLIGTTGTYSLKDQGIDEETTVDLSITRDKDNKEYILIEAVGTCQGESSTVTVRMLEEIKQGASGGIFGNETVFVSNGLEIPKEAGTIVKGNIYLDTQNSDYNAIINNLTMLKTKEHDSTLYIKNDNANMKLTDSTLADVYIETQASMQIGNGNTNSADNIYLRYTGDSNQSGTIQFNNNTIKGEAQIYAGALKVQMDNTISVGRRFIMSFNNTGTLVGGYNIETPKFYIKGVGPYSIKGSISGENYRDLNTEVLSDEKFIPKDLSFLDIEEQKISTVISRLSEIGEVLETKLSWDKEVIEQNYPKASGEQKDSSNLWFDEYYDASTNTRWVFPSYNPYYTPSTYTIKNGTSNNAATDIYYISDKYKNDTIFFINNNGDNNGQYNINMYLDSNQRLENFYVYAPYFSFNFKSEFEYFSGSIIAKSIKIEPKGPKEIEFKAPDESIDITGAPSLDGDSNNIGSSSGTTYTYKFESYVDPKKVS